MYQMDSQKKIFKPRSLSLSRLPVCRKKSIDRKFEQGVKRSRFMNNSFTRAGAGETDKDFGPRSENNSRSCDGTACKPRVARNSAGLFPRSVLSNGGSCLTDHTVQIRRNYSRGNYL